MNAFAEIPSLCKRCLHNCRRFKAKPLSIEDIARELQNNDGG